ncbi:ATP-NAD kinase-like domain-containing protein [Cladochytrium replicatum]|nr:ATP-NAD kinase-like domain-containing protein [Cladochytrium replicatum]
MAFSTPPETPVFMHTEHNYFQHQFSRSLEPDSASTATSGTFNSRRVNSNVSSDVSSNGSQLRFWDTAYCSTPEAAEEIDFIITLGGDGTVLFAAWLFQQKVPPIIPFHLGSLGFLTVFEFTKFRSSITRVLQDNHKGMRMNFRLRFACTVYRCNDGRSSRAGGLIAGTESSKNYEDDVQRQNDHGRTYHILNDLVVDRGPSPYVSQLELYGNDKHLTTVQADGLAVATPTGSTAYSLSAGGAVVHPDVSAILVTPICPHTLSFRPMILPDTMDLRIMVPPDSRATAWASFDGRHRVQLQPGDSIQVLASRYPVPTVCSGEDQSADWFESLERCLGWNKRERQKALEPATEESVMRGLRDDDW